MIVYWLCRTDSSCSSSAVLLMDFWAAFFPPREKWIIVHIPNSVTVISLIWGMRNVIRCTSKQGKGHHVIKCNNVIKPSKSLVLLTSKWTFSPTRGRTENSTRLGPDRSEECCYWLSNPNNSRSITSITYLRLQTFLASLRWVRLQQRFPYFSRQSPPPSTPNKTSGSGWGSPFVNWQTGGNLKPTSFSFQVFPY